MKTSLTVLAILAGIYAPAAWANNTDRVLPNATCEHRVHKIGQGIAAVCCCSDGNGALCCVEQGYCTSILLACPNCNN